MTYLFRNDVSVESDFVNPVDLIGLEGFDIVRQFDIASQRKFIQQNARLLTGRVLDFGCGRLGTCREPSPFRNIIFPSEYFGYDLADTDLSLQPQIREAILHEMVTTRSPYDGILCTQVLQYFDDGGARQISRFRDLCHRGSALVMTVASNWDEVEDSDLMRPTAAGIRSMLRSRGFRPISMVRRLSIKLPRLTIPIGYGVVAEAV